MNVIEAVEIIKRRLQTADGDVEVPLLKGGKAFCARLVDGGVEVENLAGQPFLPWAAFPEAICVMVRNGGKAIRVDAMNSRLGDPGLPLDSIEGLLHGWSTASGRGTRCFAALHLLHASWGRHSSSRSRDAQIARYPKQSAQQQCQSP